MNAKCKHASSGCNYPEGECVGYCLIQGNRRGFEQLDADLGSPRFFWPAVTAILMVVLIGSWALAQAYDEFSFMQELEDERVAAMQKSDLELAKRRALQEACGGPEATVVDLAHGGYACLDTNGRRTKTILKGKS